jgi:eukaryotic-like serine/threonine-protein kinase
MCLTGRVTTCRTLTELTRPLTQAVLTTRPLTQAVLTLPADAGGSDMADWQKIEEAVALAAGMPISRRQGWLDEFCAGDESLKSEIESLLKHQTSAENFLENSVSQFAAKLLPEDNGQPVVQKVGNYRIIKEIGHGGMGVVYLAEREDQFQQQVAIKLLKRGLDTEDILRRFRNERQILASLNHPNIAKLFDGGMTEDGLPYFVMEYIKGEPLADYCESHDLSIDDRLRLFRRVCAAVQHAHRNLVVHRDLKPSNILVDADGEVKLLDFGVAKLLNSDPLHGDPTMTQAAQRAMTPEYASPEQVRGQRITTAADVYSLGVVLYELLTGVKPYRLKDTSAEELSRAICESEPSKPSEAKSEPPALAGGSTSRSSHPPAHAGGSDLKALRGDLDNIVLMALRKDPERRYKSVEQFSEDIRRHLDALPIAARKDTFVYRTSKFLRRNKIAVASAVLIAMAIIAGFIGTVWQARVARAQAQVAREQRDKAQAAQARAEKINAFMQTIFSYANPDWFGRAGGRRDLSVLEAMRDVEKRIEEDFRDEPDLRADVYQQIGDAYRTQGLYDDAERNLRAALRLRLELYGEDNAKVAESMYILSGVRQQQGDAAELERLLTKALSIQRRHPDEGNNLPYMLLDYASLLTTFKNDYASALALDREALAEFHRRYGESHLTIGLTQSELVRIYTSLGDYAQAETTGSIARERFKQHPLVLWPILESDAHIKTIRGDYPAAEDAIKQMLALAQSKDAKRPMMPAVHHAQSFLAYCRGDYGRATFYGEKALATAEETGFAHNYGLHHLARSLNRLGQAKRAETLLLKEIERLNQGRVFELAKLKSVLGESLAAQRRFGEAETVLLEAYETQKARVLPQQYDLHETRQRLAALYRAWGKSEPPALAGG